MFPCWPTPRAITPARISACVQPFPTSVKPWPTTSTPEFHTERVSWERLHERCAPPADHGRELEDVQNCRGNVHLLRKLPAPCRELRTLRHCDLPRFCFASGRGESGPRNAHRD